MTAKKPAAKKPAAKKPAAKKPRAPGIGALVEELLLVNKATEDILAAIAKKFPDAATNASNVSWYRSKLRAAGKKV